VRSKSILFVASAAASVAATLAMSSISAGAATRDCKLGALDYCPNPVVHTLPAVEITGHTAVLRGEVNPNGATATCYFAWGKTKSYGFVTPNQHIAAGMKPVQLRARITGLREGTEYHFQLVCASGGHTVLGGDRAFKTTGRGSSTPTSRARHRH
jgi:hypothetical protein